MNHQKFEVLKKEEAMPNELKVRIDLVVLGHALEAIAIRSMLESFAFEVRSHFVGNAKKLVSLLNGEENLHEILILSCHGDEEGMILPKKEAFLLKMEKPKISNSAAPMLEIEPSPSLQLKMQQEVD